MFELIFFYFFLNRQIIWVLSIMDESMYIAQSGMWDEILKRMIDGCLK